MSRTKKTKSPAEKAWTTQRKRYTKEEISERYREAALKAWKTRRKNSRKKRR